MKSIVLIFTAFIVSLNIALPAYTQGVFVEHKSSQSSLVAKPKLLYATEILITQKPDSKLKSIASLNLNFIYLKTNIPKQIRYYRITEFVKDERVVILYDLNKNLYDYHVFKKIGDKFVFYFSKPK